MEHRVIGVSTTLSGYTRENFAAYRQNGIGAVEISPAAEHYDTLDLSAVVRDMRAEGLDAWSFHLRFWPFEGAYNVAALDADLRRRAVAYQAEWIRRAGAEGIRYVVIHPSAEPIADADRAESMRAACASLEELARVAQACGTVLAVENLPRTCLGKNSAEILRLTDAHPALRICFDTNHLLSEATLDFVDAVKDRLVTLHVSDYDFINERHWLPGDGMVDWRALMDRLDAIGYRGVFMYETSQTRCADGSMRPLTPADYRHIADLLEARKI